MTTATSCGWCHRMNEVSVRLCPECGHEAHVARMDCKCAQCTGRRAAADTRGGYDAELQEAIRVFLDRPKGGL